MSAKKYWVKSFLQLFVCLLLSVLILGLLTASTTDGDKLIIALPYETEGEKHWFATPTGTGDCSTWNHACTFRDAVAKCTSTVQDVIYVGAGSHDLDNGTDANGTTISVDYVHVQGMSDSCSGGPHLVNGDAAAVYVLRSTGDGFTIQNVFFDNTGETDEDVVFLNLRGSNSLVEKLTFRQGGTAGAGTGILLDNAQDNARLRCLQFEGIIDKAIQINGYDYVTARKIQIDNCGVGVSIEGASDSYIDFDEFTVMNSTTGVSITGATVTNNIFKNGYFTHNTTNIADVTAYDDNHWQNIKIGHQDSSTYPANAGVAVDSGDGAWTWTAAAVQVVPADTINNPFYITQINLQDYDASQVFKIELFWGEAAADNSLGVYEFVVGAAVQAQLIPVHLDTINTAIPATSYIGAKVEHLPPV